MRNLKTNNHLIRLFQELYASEKKARDVYDEFLRDLTNKKWIREVKKIRDDEIRHMKIVENLIALVNSGRGVRK